MLISTDGCQDCGNALLAAVPPEALLAVSTGGQGHMPEVENGQMMIDDFVDAVDHRKTQILDPKQK